LAFEDKQSAVDSPYARRRLTFAVLSLVVAGIGVWLLLSSLENSPETSGVELSAGQPDHQEAGFYTIQMVEVPAEKKAIARRLMEHQKVRELAGDDDLFLRTGDDGRLNVCVGRYESSRAEGLRELRERLRVFRLNGERIFESAEIYHCKE
jgi:hypothetical protein